MSKVQRLSWFKMSASNGVGQLDIFGDIGGYNVTFPSFARQLESMGLGAGDELKIRINSDGGDVYQGFAIYQLLALHPAQKTMTVMGLAASMASVIFMAADKRIMPANSTLMIHNPVGQVTGESDEIISFGEGVGKMKANIAAAYADASGGKLSAAKAVKLMDRQSWLGADEALALGLATEVTGAVKIAAKFDLSRFKNAPQSLNAHKEGTTMSKAKDFNFEGDAETVKAEARTELLAMQKEVNALCSVAGKPELAAAFNEDGLSLSEVVAELNTIKTGGKSEYVTTAANTTAANTKAVRATAAARAAETEVNGRSSVQTGDNATVASVDPTEIWAKWNKQGMAAH